MESHASANEKEAWKKGENFRFVHSRVQGVNRFFSFFHFYFILRFQRRKARRINTMILLTRI